MGGPTRHSTAKQPSHRTFYRRFAPEPVPLNLHRVVAEENENPECIGTTGASCDAELDRGDEFCVVIFGPQQTYVPRPTFTGGRVALFWEPCLGLDRMCVGQILVPLAW